MVLTRDFKDTIKDRVARGPAFREESLKNRNGACIENYSDLKKVYIS